MCIDACTAPPELHQCVGNQLLSSRLDPSSHGESALSLLFAVAFPVPHPHVPCFAGGDPTAWVTLRPPAHTHATPTQSLRGKSD